MAKYHRVLLATDFCSDNDVVIDKAAERARMYNADLWAIHVIEPMPAAYGTETTGAWSERYSILQCDVRRSAETMMAELQTRFEIPAERTRITEGRPAKAIHRFAEENSIDLIVMGTHGQHGLGLLLGSTANSVLHGIACDSLIVRIGG